MLKRIIDDGVVGWGAAAMTINLTNIDTLVKILVGVSVFVYTCIKIYKELNNIKNED
jgi:multisubunit Na+/H+ antiporter MnhB subunit